MDEKVAPEQAEELLYDPFSLAAATDAILSISLDDLLARIAEGPVTIEAGSEDAAVITGLAEAAATYASAIAEVYTYARDFAVA